MADKLETKLVKIEKSLGGSESVPLDVTDKLGWHLDYIESLIKGSSGGGTKLYKHTVTFTDENDDNFKLIFISHISQPMADVAYSQEEWADYIPRYGIDLTDTGVLNNLLLSVKTNQNDDGLIITYASESHQVPVDNLPVSGLTDFVDTVTEL